MDFRKALAVAMCSWLFLSASLAMTSASFEIEHEHAYIADGQSEAALEELTSELIPLHCKAADDPLCGVATTSALAPDFSFAPLIPSGPPPKA